MAAARVLSRFLVPLLAVGATATPAYADRHSPPTATIVDTTGLAGRTSALTFDDGPDPQNTLLLLKVLRRNHVRAVFCLVGEQARRYPGLVRRILAEGHVLCNHSRNHDDLSTWTPEQIRADLLDTNAAIRAAAPWARIPQGATPRERHLPPGVPFGAVVVVIASCEPPTTMTVVIASQLAIMQRACKAAFFVRKAEDHRWIWAERLRPYRHSTFTGTCLLLLLDHNIDLRCGDHARAFEQEQFDTRSHVRACQLRHEKADQAAPTTLIQFLGLLQQDAQPVGRGRPTGLHFAVVTLDEHRRSHVDRRGRRP